MKEIYDNRTKQWIKEEKREKMNEKTKNIHQFVYFLR